ncbi:hypothetical protein [Paraherbaspirillum soli]|uniref:Transposase n=1 Tax=Paraherbaspirillum soli TaxID=631222 RepID=A0ABW0MFZ5_9BURK
MKAKKHLPGEANPGKGKPVRRPIPPPVTGHGHALDGSQQLDILEEQMYVNETGPAIDQPLVPQKTTK